MSVSQTQPTNSTIPVVEEELLVNRTEVETGAVRVRIHADQRSEVVDEPVVTRGVNIRRVPRGTFVEERMQTWMEGEVMVVPVYQDVVVKRTLLVEELRLTPTTSVHHETQSLELQSETVVFERQTPDGNWKEIPLAETRAPVRSDSPVEPI